jgi:hypothetical protein
MQQAVARAAFAATIAVFCSICGAKLPPPTDAAKAQAAETRAKAAWTDKVGLYKTCVAGNKVVAEYRATLRREGKNPPAPTPTPACSDPGPYTPMTATASKPIEMSEAHSPSGTAVSPPSTNVTEGAAQGKKQ